MFPSFLHGIYRMAFPSDHITNGTRRGAVRREQRGRRVFVIIPVLTLPSVIDSRVPTLHHACQHSSLMTVLASQRARDVLRSLNVGLRKH
jgi:hypothetical protein